MDFKLRYVFTGDNSQLKKTVAENDALFKKGGVGVGDVFGGFLAANALNRITGALIEGGKAVLDYSSRLEQTKIGFETLMGGADAAAKHIKDLQEFAKTTPFAFEDLTQASRRLQNVGLAAEQVIPVMRDIGNAAAAAGASSAELDSITLAFSQIIAKGKLSAEEVNQLAERGIPVWRMLEQQLGRSKGEIIKLAEQGKISSELFLEAFQRFSQANFGDAMQKQSQTFSGAMSNIKDAVGIASSEAFAPLYERISGLAKETATRIEAQKGDFNKIGAEIGRSMGEATGLAFGEVIRDLALLQSVSPRSSKIGNFAVEFAKGTAAGIFNRQGGGGEFFTESDDPYRLAAQLKEIRKNAAAVPSLADQLKAEDAKKQAEKLSGIIRDLSQQVRLFGDDSAESATYQKLLNEGVTDFNSSLARNAISLARQLDGLRAAKKEQDAYAQGLKNAKEELERMRKQAEFEIRFPEATELDRFNQWVKDVGGGFKELGTNIDEARRKIEDLLFGQQLKQRFDFVVGFEKSVRALEVQVRPAGQSLGEKFFDAFTQELGQTSLKPADAARVARTTLAFFQRFDEEAKKAAENNRIFDASEVEQRVKEFYDTFKTDQGAQILGDPGVLLDKVRRLWDALGEAAKTEQIKARKDRLKELDTVLNDLKLKLGNQGLQRDAEDLTEFLADPEVTKAIEERAKALGITAAEIKRLVTNAKLYGGIDFDARQLDPISLAKLNENEDPFGNWRESWVRFREEIEQSANVKGTITDIGDLAIGFADNMVHAMGNAVEMWALYGDSVGVALKKALAAELAHMAGVAVVKAIYATALGFLLLAEHDYVGATNAFISAGIWAAIAGATALAAKAVAGDSFKRGAGRGGSSERSSNQEQFGAGRPKPGELEPFSRRTDETFISGRRSPEVVLANAIDRLTNKIDAARPGDVLTSAIREKRGLIADTVIREINTAGKGRDMNRALGNR
jgi:tape measure domain-containing protein